MKAIDRRLDFQHLVARHGPAEEEGGALDPLALTEFPFVRPAWNEPQHEDTASALGKGSGGRGHGKRVVRIGHIDHVGADLSFGQHDLAIAMDLAEGFPTHGVAVGSFLIRTSGYVLKSISGRGIVLESCLPVDPEKPGEIFPGRPIAVLPACFPLLRRPLDLAIEETIVGFVQHPREITGLRQRGGAGEGIGRGGGLQDRPFGRLLGGEGSGESADGGEERTREVHRGIGSNRWANDSPESGALACSGTTWLSR